MWEMKLSGSFDKTERYLKKLSEMSSSINFDTYGRMGVRALSSATPYDTGETSRSWEYRVTKSNGSTRIEWYNTNVVDGNVIAILVQYGHGTGTGGWVEGRDYINPSMRPVFDDIAERIWKEVKR